MYLLSSEFQAVVSWCTEYQLCENFKTFAFFSSSPPPPGRDIHQYLLYNRLFLYWAWESEDQFDLLHAGLLLSSHSLEILGI